MKQLNDEAAIAIRALPKGAVSACTDVTGFGLAGHASEMAIGSNVTIEIDGNALPIIPGVLAIAAQNRSGGMQTNKDHFMPGIGFSAGVPDDRRDLVFDPQTSGGLLISVAAESAEAVMANMQNAGIQAVFVGSVTKISTNRLVVR